MPRAFDRGIPEVDKNPLISATSWGDPDSVIGEAAYGAGTRIQTFLFSLFEGCGEFVTGLAEFGSTFLTELLDTLTAELQTAMSALEIDVDLVGELQEKIDAIRLQLASPNPLVTIGAGLQAFIDSIWRLFNCPDPEQIFDALTPDGLAATLEDIVADLTGNPFVQGLVALADFLGDSVGNFIRDAIIGGGRLIEILCGVFTCNPTAALQAAGIAAHDSGISGTTPFSLIAGILEVLQPILASPFVQGLVAVAEWLGRETGNFARDVFEGAIGVADWICAFLTCQPLTTGDWPEIPTGVTTPLGLLKGFADRVAPIIANPFVQGVIAFADDVGVAVGDFFLDLFNGALAFVEGLCSLITGGELPEVFGNWVNTPAQIIQQVLGIVNRLLDNPLTNGLRDLIEGGGNLLEDTIGGALQFLGDLVGLLGSALNPAAIVEFLQNAIDFVWNGLSFLTGGLVDQAGKSLQDLITLFITWLTNIPVIGPLVGIFTGDPDGTLEDLQEFVAKIPLVGQLVSTLTGLTDDDALDLSQLGAWARKLLTGETPIPAGNLFGDIPQSLLSLIPVANINIASVNLLGQGSFATAETIAAADGWSWDDTVNDPDSAVAKGSAKLTTDGTARQLYSRQSIKVAAGDKMKLSARVRTASYTGTSTSIVLSLIPFVGTTAQSEVVFATRGASNGAWVTMTGTAEDRNPWTVPAGVTSVVVKVGVTSASGSGSTVWFDNVDLRKDGLLGQNLVEFLLQAWEGAWAGLVGTSGAGKIWSDLQTAAASLRLFANGTNTNLTTLGANLLSAPASVLGSIVSVVFDGTATVGSFLVQLFNALTGNTAGSATAANVATGATSVRNTASAANTNASAAVGTANSALTAANGASTGLTNLKNSLVAGYNVVTITTSGTIWNKPADISELYVACFGGGARGEDGNTERRSNGGLSGGYVASELDPTDVPSSVTCTIGSGSSTSPSATSFGSILSSEDNYRGFVAAPLGLMATGGQPGNGGAGGFNVLNGDGQAGQTTAAGAAGGANTPFGGGAGKAGSNGAFFGLAQGGGGGGGGGSCNSGLTVGGNGGVGGYPGGGGGGGGRGTLNGLGGNGGNGLMLIIYKTAKTTT